MEDTVIFIGVEVFNSGNVFYFFPAVEMRKFFFVDKPQLRIIRFLKLRTLIFYSYLDKERFEGYRCKSGIAIFLDAKVSPWKIVRVK